MPTIMLYADSYYPCVDGVTTVVERYASELNALEGFECHIAAPAYPKYTPGDGTLRCLSVPVPGRQFYRAALPFLDGRFRESERKIAPDIVHAHTPFGLGAHAQRFAKRNGIPFVASFHTKYDDDLSRSLKSGAAADLAVKKIVRFYESADYVWTVNEYAKKLLSAYGYDGPAEVMKNGVDTVSESDYARYKSAAAVKWLSGRDPPYLLFVGQIVSQKNIFKIAEAAASLSKSGVKFTLVFAGRGPDLEKLKGFSARLGLTRAVFTGFVEKRTELLGLYALADLFVFPSVYDTAGIVVAEAAAAGCPSVTVIGSGASSGITDCRNGFLCENNAESLAEKIRFALANPELRKKCGENAAKTLVRSWPEVCRLVCKRYREIADGGKSVNLQ